jgi:hypothetical protein
MWRAFVYASTFCSSLALLESRENAKKLSHILYEQRRIRMNVEQALQKLQPKQVSREPF